MAAGLVMLETGGCDLAASRDIPETLIVLAHGHFSFTHNAFEMFENYA